MHVPLSTATELSAQPESPWVLPESSSVTAESESPFEDPLLEAPLLEELPLEEPPLDVAPPESSRPPEAPSGAAASLDSTGLEASGDLVAHAGTREAVTSAKPQRRTDRAFMSGDPAIPMPCSSRPETPDDPWVPLEGCGAPRRTGVRTRRAATGISAARQDARLAGRDLAHAEAGAPDVARRRGALGPRVPARSEKGLNGARRTQPQGFPPIPIRIDTAGESRHALAMVGKAHDLVRACQQIIDAVSALSVNVEMLAEAATPAQAELLEDSRKSVQTITELARRLRTSVEG
jgi:hypothetical protein